MGQSIKLFKGERQWLRQDQKCNEEKSKRQKGDRVVSYSLGRVGSGKQVCNEVKLIYDKITTDTFYNKKNFMKVINTYG